MLVIAEPKQEEALFLLVSRSQNESNPSNTRRIKLKNENEMSSNIVLGSADLVKCISPPHQHMRMDKGDISSHRINNQPSCSIVIEQGYRRFQL